MQTTTIAALLLCASATAAFADFDGAYSGMLTPKTGNNVDCQKPFKASMTVRGGRLTYDHAHHALIETNVGSDGSFTGSAQNKSAVLNVQTLRGRIQGGVLTAETENPWCKYSIELTKTQ